MSRFEKKNKGRQDVLHEVRSTRSFHVDTYRMVDSLVFGGIFSGQLFGHNDDWSNNPSMTFNSKDQIKDLLGKFEIIKFEEVEKDAQTASGNSKHWHIFPIIFRKIK